ncbi:MAG: hypothetical protein DIU78_002935 [Pseudomonadota bacterium]
MNQRRAALVAALAPALAATACGDGRDELLFAGVQGATSSSGATGGAPSTASGGDATGGLDGGTAGMNPSGGLPSVAETGGAPGTEAGGMGLGSGTPEEANGGDAPSPAPTGGSAPEGGSANDEAQGGAAGLGGEGGQSAMAGAAGEGEPPEGGSAGTAGAGGTAGVAGGGGTAESASGCATPGLVDDMEDGDDVLCTHEGRSGTWFTANDGSVNGVQEPPLLAVVRPVEASDRAESTRAMRTTGSGFSNWGAALGFHLRSTNGEPYDASGYGALTFYAKGKVNGKLRVALRTRDLAPPDQGGTCRENSGTCLRYHGADIALTTNWHQYRIPFETLAREGNGGPSFDPKSVVGVEFRVPVPAAIQPFEVWVDDVAFETRAP